MEKIELEKQVAHLESVNDQLSAEISYVDDLLKSIGFPYGLQSVKAAANEMLNNGSFCEEQ